MPGSQVPVPEFGLEETALTWVNWARDHDRRLRAAVLEWVLMNPTQGPLFLSRVGTDPDFRKVFLGHYHDVGTVLGRLGSAPIKPPFFFLERIEKAKGDLDAELKLLEVARREVAAREERTIFLQNVLDKACAGGLEVLIGYNSRIPALPP